jgi:hypothetical protein
LAKIIDSHPDVVYRHEPDIPDRHGNLPIFCLDDQVEYNLPLARQCVADYINTRHVRATAVKPIFHKNYLTSAQYKFRKSLIYLLRASETLKYIRDIVYKVPVPDFVDVNNTTRTCAIKSIRSLGRVNLLLNARPEAKFILIIRHPCGYVASRLRGLEAGGEWRNVGTGLPQYEQARRRGLTRDAIEAMPVLDRLAWVWTIFNEKAVEDAADKENVRILRYEDLCASPMDVARDLFAFIGLDWNGQTEAFLSQSTSHKGKTKFYSVFRDTKLEIGKWKALLTPEQIQTIRTIADESLAGRLFAEDLKSRCNAPLPQCFA